MTRSTIVNIHVGYGENGLLDFTGTQRAYAARHGYEYRQVTRNLIEGAKPTWSKYPAALEIIAERDAVMIIDSDAAILEHCPPFHELVEANARHDLFLALGHSFRPNAGVMMLRGGGTGCAERFMRQLLAERELPPQDKVAPGGDNGHVISLLRRPEFGGRLFILPPTWNNTTKPSDWDNIRHYTGPMRQSLMAGTAPQPQPGNAAPRTTAAAEIPG